MDRDFGVARNFMEITRSFHGEWKPSSGQSDCMICDKYDHKQQCTESRALHTVVSLRVEVSTYDTMNIHGVWNKESRVLVLLYFLEIYWILPTMNGCLVTTSKHEICSNQNDYDRGTGSVTVSHMNKLWTYQQLLSCLKHSIHCPIHNHLIATVASMGIRKLYPTCTDKHM